MNIEKLNWDSDFFGYQVGKINIFNHINFEFSQFKKLAQNYRLIYVFSDKKIQNKYIKLVDQKITFHHKLFETNFDNLDNTNISSFNPKIQDYNQIRELALSSGVYSRFKIDKNFKDNEYERLYSQWIKNSVENKKLFEVLVYSEDNEILGFLTIKKVHGKRADIGLVAVNARARGKGVGTKLIESSKKIAKDKGFREIQVITQKENIPAMKLYNKCGFRKKKITYIYHFWKI